MSREFIFEFPIRFVVGTVGLPGDRTFYIQISSQVETIYIRLEKNQAAVIANQLESFLEDNFQADFDHGKRETPSDLAPLNLPISEQYDLIGVGFLLNEDIVQIDFTVSGQDANENIDIRVRLHGDLVKDFCARTRNVVAAGRATCPFCLLPLDITGHICSRSNGYRR